MPVLPRVGPIEVFTVARIVKGVGTMSGEGTAGAKTPSPSPSPLHRGEGKFLRGLLTQDTRSFCSTV
jgi:hypothetical protein